MTDVLERPRTAQNDEQVEHFDVLVVGAGISGSGPPAT
jgi:glycerol-3-phosphate dehydrogenase